MGATIGAAAIPGAGPILAPIVAGAMTAGQSALQGQGPLTSLGSGAIAGGMSAGMGALNNAISGPSTNGTTDLSNQFAGQYSLADPNMLSGLPNDSLTRWSINDLHTHWFNGGL